jgi:hypothetical protein
MHRKNEQDSKPVFPSRTAQSISHSHQPQHNHFFDLANRLRQRPGAGALDLASRLRQRPGAGTDRNQTMHRKNEQDSKPVFPSRTAQSTTHSHQLKQTHLFDLANRLRQRPDPAPDRTQIMHQKNKQNTKPVFAKTRRPINLPLPSTEKIQLQASRVWQRPGRPQPTQYPHPKQKPHNTCIQPVLWYWIQLPACGSGRTLPQTELK